MDEGIRSLVEAARGGDSAARLALAWALRRPPGASVELLGELALHEEPNVRAAVALALAGRTDPGVHAIALRLAEDADVEVRLSLAQAAAGDRAWDLGDVRRRLMRDPDSVVRLPACRAARGHADLVDELLGCLEDDEDWTVRQAAAEGLTEGPPTRALPALLAALRDDQDRDVQRAAATAAERLLAQAEGWPPDVVVPPVATVEATQAALARHGPDRFPRLRAWLEGRLKDEVNPERLATFGRDLTAEAEAGRLARAHGLEAPLAALTKLLQGSGTRSAVVVGPPGSGKTALVHELVHRLREDPAGPWRVLRVSASDLLAGTIYLGEWQTKVRNLVEAVQRPRRVVLYVPNLEELSAAGRSSNSDLNVATMLAPYVETGAVAVVGESTTEAFRSGLGGLANLRRLFPVVELRAAGPDETLRILREVRREEGLDAPEPVLERLRELAGMYMPGTVEPGRSVGLLRRVAEAARAGTGPVRPRAVLETLSASTGIPVDFLDDDVPLDLAHVRSFFERRVMGQPEAVGAVVDLVALVKAGLTDPGKPFGVLLFIGPTGVGKTEMARALAELLFGDAGRLQRFDMSEYATPEGYERLIGFGSRPGTLTSAVREQPFSVVLLDEIEKAHLNVFDLCLQVFDAGRLTDGQGRTADFRRTIVILTSNVGSAVPTEAPVGFGQGAAEPPPDPDAVLRELRRWFRPEFLNRLDQVINFRPLSVETAEQIARREVTRVVERSGISRRRLAVSITDDVLALLLRRGYSPAFGARPLKRTVERLVLLPVARALAEGAVVPGSVLSLVAQGEQVGVQVVPSETAEAAPRTRGAPTPSVAERRAELETLLGRLRPARTPLEERKSELVARARREGLWDEPSRAVPVIEEIRRIEGTLAALASLERRAGEALPDRARPRTPKDAARLEERLLGLLAVGRHVEYLLSCRDAQALADAFLVLTRVKADGSGLGGVEKLAGMYDGLARRRDLAVEVLDDRRGDDPPEDTLTLLVQGAGAHALLAEEAGLHQFTRGWSEAGARGKRRTSRELVRVEVLPAPLEVPDRLEREVRVRSRALRGAKARLGAPPTVDVTLLHEPSMTSTRAHAAGPKADAVRRLLPLLLARIDAGSRPPRPARAVTVVRRYVLGPSPHVKDRRSGLQTGNLDRVLQGDLDPFLRTEVAS